MYSCPSSDEWIERKYGNVSPKPETFLSIWSNMPLFLLTRINTLTSALQFCATRSTVPSPVQQKGTQC